MPNINGKTYALNIITPVKPLRMPQLTIGFALARRFPNVVGELKRCGFIFFARWVIIRDFPHLDASQPEEELNYSYLLFMSNFNGSWSEYFDTFSSVITPNINDIWQACLNFPGASPVSPLRTYARKNQVDTDYGYIAYRGATTRDVRAALKFKSAFDQFESKVADLTPEEFESAFRAFLTTVQEDLGSAGIRTAREERRSQRA